MKKFTFKEVKVYPPVGERYFQLFVDGNPRLSFYSESHLKKCLSALEDFFAMDASL